MNNRRDKGHPLFIKRKEREEKEERERERERNQ